MNPNTGQGPSRSVAILLSTYNGAPYLAEQLGSFLGQTHRDWVLYWRDDGSSDATREIAAAFVAELPPERAVVLRDGGRVGSTESFLRLLHAATAGEHAAFAFADQDDVWLPHKISRGLEALERTSADGPVLYCARHIVTDAQLRPIALSRPVRRCPGFPAALTQNVASGCTMLLNRPAADLVCASRPPAAAMHDWWSYVLVSAAGGQVVVDDTPVMLYRQHGGNAVGAPASDLRRCVAALRRGPSAFMRSFRQHVAALSEQTELLSPAAAAQVSALDHALRAPRLSRIKAACTPGLARQSRTETALFWLWLLLG